MTVRFCRKWKWTIYCSFLFAVFLQIIPWPNSIADYLPNWILLIFLYWTFMSPYYVNIGTGFLMGSILDFTGASTMGLRALSMSTVAYIAITKSHLFQNLAYWQQVPIVILLSIGGDVIIFWVELLIINSSSRPIIFWNSILNGIFWPWLCLLMNRICFNFFKHFY